MITQSPEEEVATPTETPGNKAPVTPRKAKSIQTKRSQQSGKPKRQASKPAAAARRGSKTAKVLNLLKRPGGASLNELMKATGWQAHSVRGFLSGTLKKKMALKLESSRREDQERAYRLRSK